MLQGTPDFESRLAPRLRKKSFFLGPTEAEIDAVYEPYVRGDYERMCDAWKKTCAAQRAKLPPMLQRGYDRAGLLPRLANGYSFIVTMRSVLDAGIRFRAGLSRPLFRVLERDVPWLENRREHVPPGWSPRLDFPTEFALWLDVPDLEVARLRWQLVALFNEVQQHHQTEDCARRFRLPELSLQAARERELAINYSRHLAPPVTRALLREVLYILDALNAGVFEMLCVAHAGEMVRRCLAAAVTKRDEWRAFVDGLAKPQWLLPV